MNFQELKEALVIKNGVLTILEKTFEGAIAALIKGAYKELPMTLSRVEITKENEAENTLEISGQGDLLNVPNLPVTGRFFVDENGEAQLTLAFRLREGVAPRENSWKFSNSFPEMPVSKDYSSTVTTTKDGDLELTKKPSAYLDSLYLYDTFYVVSSVEQEEDATFGIPLIAGINFVSKMQPQGMLGVLESTVGVEREMTLYGRINIPWETDETVPLRTDIKEYVWDKPEVPGIHLQAKMDVDFKFGDLTFNQAYFRVYSPHSQEWAEQNMTYKPVHGYSGVIAIPSAGIEIDLNADLKWGMPEAFLFARCEGLSIENLAHLADASGTDNLTAHLPEQIQEAVEKLEELELMNIGLSVELAGAIPTVSNAFFTIGMPHLDWHVWEDHFILDSISTRFEVDNPMAHHTLGETETAEDKTTYSVTVLGTMEVEGIPVSVSAQSVQGFTLYAQINESETIPLNNLMKKYTPGIPAPSDLTVDRMAITVAPGNLYGMSVILAGGDNPWVIPVGHSGLEISDVYFDFTKKVNEGLTGTFAGCISLSEDAQLFMNYHVPGGFLVRGKIPKITLRQIIDRMCNQDVAIPEAFDLHIPESMVMIQEMNGNFKFQLIADIEDTAYVGLEVQEVNGQWGIAAGLALQVPPSEVSGMSALKAIEEVVQLEELVLIASSFDGANFRFPNTAQFGNPALTNANVPMPKQSGGLVAGLNVYAKWMLHTETDHKKDDLQSKVMQVLQTVLGLDPELAVTLQLGTGDIEAKMFTTIDTTFMGHHQFNFQFGMEVMSMIPELFLAGKLHSKIDNKPAIFDVVMSVVVGGIYFSGSMEGTLKFGHLQLSDLALALGLDWVGLPSLGYAATIDSDGFESSIAIMLDSTDPAKSLLAGSVTDLSLKNVAHYLAHVKELPKELDSVLDSISISGTKPFNIPASLADKLDNLQLDDVSKAFLENGKVTLPSDLTSVLVVVGKKGKEWNITDKINKMRHYQLVKKGDHIVVTQDTQLYLSPMGAQLGDLVYPKGFFVNGALNVLGLKWETQVDIEANKGIAVSSNMNKALTIFDPKFFKFSDVSGKTGPFLSLSTFSQPDEEREDFRPPHLYIDGKLHFIGLTITDYIKATTKGFELQIEENEKLSLPGKVLSGSVAMDYKLHAVIGSLKHIEAGADIDLKMKGKLNLGELKLFGKKIDLGHFHLDLEVDGSFDMGYDGKEAYVKFKGGFELEGHKHNFHVELDAKNADITKAGHLVLNELEKVFKEIFKTAEQFVNAVKDGVIALEKGAEQMAHALKNAYKKTAQEAMKLTHAVEKDFNKIAGAFKTVYKADEKAIGHFMKGVGADANKIAGTLKHSFKADSKKVAGVLKDIGHGPEDIANAMKKSFKLSSKDTAKVMKGIKSSAEDISKAMNKTFGKPAKETAKILKEAGVDPSDVGKAMNTVFKLSTKDAGKLMKDTFHLNEKDMKKVLKGAGYAAKDVEHFASDAFKDVGKALKSIFG